MVIMDTTENFNVIFQAYKLCICDRLEFAKGQIYDHNKRYDKCKGKCDQRRQYKNGKISF